MKVEGTDLEGVATIDPLPHVDERGSFARTFDRDRIEVGGAPFEVRQCSISRNTRADTLRGIHLQLPPHPESKIVRCTRGAIFDVVVDLRPESPTYRRHLSFELDDEGGRAVLIPPRCGHGFQTLTDSAEVLYMMDAPFAAGAAAGVRWDDETLGIGWPVGGAERIISERDRALPSLAELEARISSSR